MSPWALVPKRGPRSPRGFWKTWLILPVIICLSQSRSLVDVTRLVSGKSASDSAQDVRVVLEVLKDNIFQFKFPGAGRYTTPVADLRPCSWSCASGAACQLSL